ncbi:hypothetical protein [uncultured Desulfobacter sp.]|uniref:hypothetical protein n=1 Tax=uncultured Desulfobacter sp. TaxID=240139 RepID=UPI0029F50C36|nr:hypothetical protein [uncultured Desulfobacter sp.]
MKRRTNQSTNFFTSYVIGAAALFSVLLLTIAINPVMAGDAKTYPGSMGVKYSGGNPSYNASMMGNPNTSYMYVDLPAINDSMSESVKNAWVGVLDRHYDQDVRCSFNSVYWNNTNDTIYGWWGGNKYSNGSSNDRQVLSWGRVGGAGETVHHYFSCRVPANYNGNRSYIISYHVNED